MKATVVVRIVVALLGFVVGFWLYGVGRTMRETVGFNATALFCGLLSGVVLPLALVLPLLLARTVWPVLKWWIPHSMFITLAAALLIGGLLSEWWILHDERKFSIETLALDKPHSRPRAWPNSGCSLVFVPGKGIRATD
jgi:hypothetical protein